MAFGPIIKFKTNDLNLELAPLTRDDMSEFINYEHGGGLQRYSVTKFLGMSTAPTLEDELDWYDKARTESSRVLWGVYIINDETGARELIGNSALVNIGKIGHTTLFRHAISGSVIFKPEYWGRGIASAAHKVRVWYAFEHLGLSSIKSGVIQGNGGSSKALGRSGYVYTHTDRNDQYSDGELHHTDNFECLNPLDLFWDKWWRDETPSEAYLEGRQKSLEAIAWAKENAELV